VSGASAAFGYFSSSNIVVVVVFVLKYNNHLVDWTSLAFEYFLSAIVVVTVVVVIPGHVFSSSYTSSVTVCLSYHLIKTIS